MMDKDAVDLSNLLIGVQPKPLDLTQAVSLHDTAGYATSSPSDLTVNKLRRMLETLMEGLTESTSKVLDKQTAVITDFMTNVQDALNDIDQRLSLQSQQQAQIEQVLDSLIKLWLLGGTDANVDDQKRILEEFIARGLPQPLSEADNG